MQRPGIQLDSAARRGFSLAELLVVVGVIALLLALLLPPLQLARRQAMDTYCAASLQQLGVGLSASKNEFDFYPLWDDGGLPTRFTWIDVLVQRRMIGNSKVGYCPNDGRPDLLNSAHARSLGLIYPGGGHGMDYSYGIGLPLSAGGWAWRPGYSENGDERPRRFENPEDHPARRVLAGDGNWSWLYNVGGNGLVSGIWNDPTWFSNTVAYRHDGRRANVLKQDGHVERIRYNLLDAEPVNTSQHFVWQPGEPIDAGPDTRVANNFYPHTPPPSFQSIPAGETYPTELLPYYYTVRRGWTLIQHKVPGTANGGYE